MRRKGKGRMEEDADRLFRQRLFSWVERGVAPLVCLFHLLLLFIKLSGFFVGLGGKFSVDMRKVYIHLQLQDFGFGTVVELGIGIRGFDLGIGI